MKIGAAGFIVPFMFVYEPALLMLDPALFGKSHDLVTAAWPAILQASGTACIGCLLLAAGLHGYLITAASWWQRALLVAAALMFISPSTLNDIIGLGLAAIVAAAQLLARHGDASEARPQA